MRSLLLTPHDHRSPREVATWFGAMQAQDVASGAWSLGTRIPGSTEADIHAAFERAEVLRTWPMRQTVHIVPATDARWMLEVTGVRGLSNMVRRRKELGLLPQDLERACDTLRSLLSGGGPKPRADLLAALADEGIPTDGQRGYHLLAYASLIGLTCIGPQRGSVQTIALLDEWAPQQVELSREDALVELAHRYVRSHGPAPLKDFAGWTGLTLADARIGLSGNEGRLTRIGDGADALWLTSDLAETLSSGEVVDHATLALPGYDEYLLGYKDRSLHGDEQLLDRVVPGGNGVFRATIVIRGSVVATWKRTLSPTRVHIEVEPFASLTKRQRAATEGALGTYAAYLERDPVIRFAD